MIVSTYSEFDIETGLLLLQEVEEYFGPIHRLKGSETDQSAAHSSLSFLQSLPGLFKQQFGAQSGILSFLTNGLEKFINNPQGFDQATKAALTSGAINNTATQVANATRAANAAQASHGGSGLPSGVAAQINGQIASAGAGALSGQLNDIALQDQQLKNQNYWNSVGALGGVASQYNPLGYASAFNGTGNSISGLSEASTQADKSGFFSGLANSFAGGFGQSLGAGLGGGIKIPGLGGH